MIQDKDPISKTTSAMDTSDVRQRMSGQGGRFRRNENGEPRLYVSFGHGILMFPLHGHQSLGRTDGGNNPDIAIDNSFVSRNHGVFDTSGEKVIYTAADTRNGIYLNHRYLLPGESVQLEDGDELSIPAKDGEADIDIMLNCAISKGRIDVWEMLRRSSKDKLTGLSDRGMFSSWYRQHCHMGKWSRGCVFILDVDDFKTINDSYGHSAGDAALRRMGQRLTLMLQSTECVCRWGGDEFAGLLAKPPEEAEHILNELRESVAGEKVDGIFHMTVSIGFVSLKDLRGVENLDSVVDKADQALYIAKLDGKNRVARYQKKDPAEPEPSEETMTWISRRDVTGR